MSFTRSVKSEGKLGHSDVAEKKRRGGFIGMLVAATVYQSGDIAWKRLLEIRGMSQSPQGQGSC
jgi:hypothetical protein